ncbi:MAG: DUF3842 family protein [Solobacterium sp.]|nr:DUF3842 family protein [Solobacterium sp.]MBQ6531906.1 DUF3842 family protein [Solobacterium sp.]
MKTILVIDAQGGGIGRQLITAVRKEIPEVKILAVGTNTTAVTAMLKAGADEAATGENAVRVACRKADVIVGPLGIVIADAMLGEITPAMAAAVGQSDAAKILIPFRSCDNVIVGVKDLSTAALIQEAVREIITALQ